MCSGGGAFAASRSVARAATMRRGWRKPRKPRSDALAVIRPLRYVPDRMQPSSIIEREKSALAAHRAALRGSELPRPSDAPKGTFVHGFFLPFTLIVATLRDRELRGPICASALVRGLIVVHRRDRSVAKGNIYGEVGGDAVTPAGGVIVHSTEGRVAESPPVHVDMPGLNVDLDTTKDQASVSVLGQQVPVTDVDDDAPKRRRSRAAAEPPRRRRQKSRRRASAVVCSSHVERVRASWRWLLALFAFLSATEGVVVFFSRRWDDWLSFHASRLVAIRPEDETPKTPKLAVDLRWLYRKMKRRLRGYVVLAAGIPAARAVRVVPTAGSSSPSR